MTGRPKSQPTPVALIAALRQDLGMDRKQFSRLMGFSERTVARWEKGEALSEPAARRVRELRSFQQRLATVVRKEAIAAWLETPNAAFGELKPLEVLNRGEIDRLRAMTFHLESGVAT